MPAGLPRARNVAADAQPAFPRGHRPRADDGDGGEGGVDGVEGRHAQRPRGRGLLSRQDSPGPSLAPLADLAEKQDAEYGRNLALAKALAASPAEGGWSVTGARVHIGLLGYEVVRALYDFLCDAREAGELGHIRNPGGYFVASLTKYAARLRAEGRTGHPHAPGE